MSTGYFIRPSTSCPGYEAVIVTVSAVVLCCKQTRTSTQVEEGFTRCRQKRENTIKEKSEENMNVLHVYLHTHTHTHTHTHIFT
ncbi:hypothetical protein EXN66_Car016920 [Channa argus]|uniref:Uncharacterized protein n=1 Tax=Channa argus TaxID=215402 RepID=A0A6G1QFA2_CHAAH|nr:hypothetical protein EXN66_Car016920 [Channa argus]